MKNEVKRLLLDNKNMILTGAPGTGKTYVTAEIAVAICKGIKVGSLERKEIMDEYKKLVESGQVAFTTFHQSMDYEEFVEGLKPTVNNGNVTYEVKPGIFRKICEYAKLYLQDEETTQQNENVDYNGSSQENINQPDDNQLYDSEGESEVKEFSRQNENMDDGEESFSEKTINNPEESMTYSQRGTENYSDKEKYIGRIVEEFLKDSKNNPDKKLPAGSGQRFIIKDYSDDEIQVFNEGNKGRQNYTVNRACLISLLHSDRKIKNKADMFEFLKNVYAEDQPMLEFVEQEGENVEEGLRYLIDIYRLIEPQIEPRIKAIKNPETRVAAKKEILDIKVENEDKSPKFVLIIDEINRGNISKIFGELITLLEKDKRLGTDNEITVTLPYSQDEFGVPKNLYILGTMNTADRSIGQIDYALRRRFAFYSLKSEKSVIEDYYKKYSNESAKQKALALFTAISTFFARDGVMNEDLKAADLMVGHSYFLCKPGEHLKNRLDYEIIPLIEEYVKDGIMMVEKEELKKKIGEWQELA